jgi:hypothetical protein
MSDNTFIELIREAAYRDSPVTRVEYFKDPDLPKRPVAIRMSFTDGDLFVLADGDDDSIRVANEVPREFCEGLEVINVTDSDSWRRIIGARLVWGWLLTNHQGYTDGTQFEFRGGSLGDTSCVQLLVMASTLDVRTVLLP